MKKLLSLILFFSATQMMGCVVAPYDYTYDRENSRDAYNHRDRSYGNRSYRYPAEEPDPYTFYGYASEVGQETTSFNPCAHGIADQKSTFKANSDMSDESERGRRSKLRANVKKEGTCE